MKRVLAGLMGAAAVASVVSLAPTANAYPWLSYNENQYLNALYATNIGPRMAVGG